MRIALGVVAYGGSSRAGGGCRRRQVANRLTQSRCEFPPQRRDRKREHGMRKLLLASCAVLALSAGTAFTEKAFAQNTVNNSGTSTINGGASLGAGTNISGTSTLTGMGSGGSGANSTGASQSANGDGSGNATAASTAAGGSGTNAGTGGAESAIAYRPLPGACPER